MGNSSSPTSSQQILQKYTFIKPVSQSKNLYKERQTKKQFISVERTFPNQQAITDYQKSLRAILEVQHPYFLNETQHAMMTMSMLCSVQYRVVHLFEYEPHCLEQELQTRKMHERYFEEKEIWSILCSTVLAMAHLTKNDIPIYTIHPKHIAIDNLGMVKLMSPLLTDSQTPEITDHSLYYSPQHIKSLKTQSFSPLSNKSSVFSLGITLLHILSLEPMNEIYNFDNFTLNVDLLNQLVEKIAHPEIKDVIKKMVKIHGYDRITFTELEEMLYDVLQGDEREGNQKNHEKEGMNYGLENSIHRLAQSHESNPGKDSHMMSYQTGSSSLRQYEHTRNNSRENYSLNNGLDQNQSFNNNKILQPLDYSPQDINNLPCYESGIDVEKLDEEDKSQKEIEIENSYLPESHLMDGMLFLGNLTDANICQVNLQTTPMLAQTSDNKTLRKALQEVNSFHNVTLGKSLTQISSLPSSSNSTHPYHVRQQLKRGIYEGYKLNNMRHGYGVFYYSDGGKYAGQWSKNKMQGRGALYYANEQIAYEGEWFNDKLHGYGVLFNEIPTFSRDAFNFRTLHLVDNLWAKYQGNFVEDQKCGHGTLFLSNGEYYTGEFCKDFPHGNGVFKCLDGSLIRANWVWGMMQ